MTDTPTDPSETMNHWRDIHAIETLKAQYFRFLDTKQWDALRALLTDDFEGIYRGPHPDIHFSSADEMVETNRKMLADAATVHHGHTPEIEITGPDTAIGIWAMVDIVKLGDGFTGYGHYHDAYRKVDGTWKISKTRLERTHIEPGKAADD